MRAIVTGAAGFIGSHLCEALVARGDEVVGIDDLSTGRVENIHGIGYHPRFSFIQGNAGDWDLMGRWTETHDCVYHLASSVGVKRIIDRPVEAVRNIVGVTDTVLALCSQYHKPVLVTSTSEVYGKGNGVPFREDDDVVLGPTSSPRWAYAAAKMTDEFLALAYYRETELPIRIVRLFNTVGPRQTGQYGMVIPRFIEQAKAGEPLTVYGNGEQTRCFASVHDIVPGLIALMDCEAAAGRVVNLGTDEEISIDRLADWVTVAVHGENAPITVHYMSHEQAYGIAFDDMQRRIPDLTRARELIGWAPKWGLRDILEELCR